MKIKILLFISLFSLFYSTSFIFPQMGYNSVSASVPYQSNLDTFLERVKQSKQNMTDAQYEARLNKFQSLLEPLKQKYNGNTSIISIINYLQNGITQIQNEFNQAKQNNEISDFFRDFLGVVDSVEPVQQPIQNPQINTSLTQDNPSSDTPTPDTPTSGYIFKKYYTPNQFSPAPGQCRFYQTEGASCARGQECILGSTNYNLKCEYDGPPSGDIIISTIIPNNNIIRNCNDAGVRLSLSIWTSLQDIKICMEHELTAEGRVGEIYKCDSDSKFVHPSLLSGNPWRYDNIRGVWTYGDFLQNHSTYVPGKYRVTVKTTDGVIKYGEWITIETSGQYSDPANCSYYKYPAKSVEDAIWYLMNNKKAHIGSGIDWNILAQNLPSSCNISSVQTDFINSAHHGCVGCWVSQSCYTKPVPTWTGPTFTGGFGSRVKGQTNNEAEFDFKSWYLGGYPWKLGGAPCGNVPRHSKSQVDGGIKWEYGKIFNCGAGTYGGVDVKQALTPSSVQENYGICNFTGNKTLYYKNNNTCISANFSCNNGQLIRGGQFSPRPPKPITRIFYETDSECRGFSISQTKTQLKEEGDKITYYVYGLTRDNAMSCQAVIAHPYVPSAVNPNYCNDKSSYKYLKDIAGWTYNNGVWRREMTSNKDIYLKGIKVQAHFMNSDKQEKKSANIVEIIENTNTNTAPIQTFSISQTKTQLKEEGDKITYYVYGLTRDNAMSCQAVIAHPYVPSAVNPNYCNDKSSYKYLKDIAGWKYNNGVWIRVMTSNKDIYLKGIKVQAHFMNSDKKEKRSAKIVEIIE